MNNSKTIKSIMTKRYEAKLVLLPSDMYVVQQTNFGTEVTLNSAYIKDFKIASYLFDLTIDQLEGN